MYQFETALIPTSSDGRSGHAQARELLLRNDSMLSVSQPSDEAIRRFVSKIWSYVSHNFDTN